MLSVSPGSVSHRRGDDEFVFPGLKGKHHVSANAIDDLIDRMGFDHLTTTHGLRPTFRDWVGDETGYPREVAEAALAHAVGDEAEQAYRRGDALERRRGLMEAWAAYCTGMTGGGSTALWSWDEASPVNESNIVTFPKRAA
jgi:integrase